MNMENQHEHNTRSHAYRRDRDAGERRFTAISVADMEVTTLSSSSSQTPKRAMAARALLVRTFFVWLVALAAVSWAPIAQAQNFIRSSTSVRIGATPAEIQANFPATIHTHLRELHASGGDVAVFKFLWSLSAFQLYEFEDLYNATAPSHVGLPRTLFAMFYDTSVMSSAARGAAIRRLAGANLMFNTPVVAVPGGRRAVAKIMTIAGFPANATLYEVWLEYATAPGYTTAQSIASAVWDFAGPLSKSFGTGYLIGTGISWLIQTFDPSLQIAIGDFIGHAVEGTVSVLLDPAIDTDINTIDQLGSPGLNEVDFDGYQLGAITTAEFLPW
jgi:hypothetical protein